jgi:probable rRNA maturation factor
MQKAVEQAKLYDHSLQREVGFLTAHSMLHLLGYDHEQGSEEAELMREKERQVMEILGLPRVSQLGVQ